MKKVLLAIPYNDAYSLNKFGYARRDNQIIFEIQKSGFFDDIFILNRPVSIYERMTTKPKKNSIWPGIKTIDVTSYDLFGPLKGRAWTKNCYNYIFKKTLTKLIKIYQRVIILDFRPISIFPIVKSFDVKVVYWYDLIDNFVKHNRYSCKEKALVKQKYQYVRDNYDFVTGVTLKAIEEVGHHNSVVLSNGIFDQSIIVDNLENNQNSIYDFGFIGFITDKFDIDFVAKLINNGYSVVIYGEILHKKTGEKLKNIGAHLKGSFKYDDIPNIVNSFKIGLIPYLENKSHDGFPMKLYEYLKYNKPCLTSQDYDNLNNKYVINYNKTNVFEGIIEQLIAISGKNDIRNSILVEKSHFLSYKIAKILNLIDVLLH